MLSKQNYRTIHSAIAARFHTYRELLLKPVDSATLATFRVFFGALMIWEVWRYVHYNRIYRYYLEPDFFFTYEFFPFVSPWPGNLMYWHFFAMGVLALGVMLGFFYRISAFLFCLAYSYVFLLDKAQYNNHYYLIILLAFLLVIVDAHRWASVDQKRSPAPGLIPFWQLAILRAQIVIVYFYGGLAKLNLDWLAGEPMRTWLFNRSDYPWLGPFLGTEGATYFFTYGGLFFDLSIGFWLLWKPARLPAFIGILFFNLMNHWLFNIGIFPFMMIAATILFAEPDLPRRLLRLPRLPLPPIAPKTAAYRSWVFSFIAIYLALQILAPLRHWLYPGDVAWTEEGHRFSWRMKLRTKGARLAMWVTDPATRQTWPVDFSQDLTARQQSKMANRPDMILQYVHHLAQKYRQAGLETPIVQVDSWMSLNYRPYRPAVDLNLNLAEIRDGPLAHSAWILPLDKSAVPLPISERTAIVGDAE